MKQYYSDVIQFKGSHYDFGYMQGELLKQSPILYNRKKQWKPKRKRHFVINQTETLILFKTFMPAMIDELRGLADALDWPMEDAIREFGGYYINYERSGCSILTGRDYFVRNYDSHPISYEGRYMIYEPTDGGYATIGPTMQITGRTDGMNEKGLVMGYNFINRVGSEDGFLCNMIGRMVLETCASIDEAVALLKEIPHRTSFNYVLMDKSGESVVVEASPRKVAVRRANISTNHFDMLTDENRYRLDDSLRREAILKEKRHDHLGAYAAYELLNDTEGDVFSEKYDASAGTIHTAAYLPEEGIALFTIGGNRKPVVFNFREWLGGKRTPIKRINGMLAYDKSFVNMTKLYP